MAMFLIGIKRVYIQLYFINDQKKKMQTRQIRL